MKDFNIAKYLKEHNLGSYGILNHYIDLKPLKEEETEEKSEIPYEGPDKKLTGMGGGDSFKQEEIVSESTWAEATIEVEDNGDGSYSVICSIGEDIEITGTLEPYDTGRGDDYSFNPDPFISPEAEDYYDENWETIEAQAIANIPA